jgi:multiple sugar transport system permease protein
MMTLPALLIMAGTVLYPIIWSLVLSFSDSASVISGKLHVIGFANYINALQSKDFLNALSNTAVFVICTIVVEIIVGFVVSLTLNTQPPGHKVFNLLFSLPLMVAPLVSGLQWRWMLTDQYGVINNILAIFGIEGPTWFAKGNTAFAAIVMANVWLAVPFCILVLVAALLSLPKSLYEAGRLDGANLIQEFLYITLPQLKTSILTILVVRVADAFRVFDVVYILTNGGPGNATEVVSTFIYTTTFTRLKFGIGAAASFISLIMVGIVCFVLFKLMGDSEEDVL